MIGGIDVRLPTSAGPRSMEVAVRAIRQLWPRAVFENGNIGTRYDSFTQIPFSEIEELFIYRDAQSAETWEAKGAVPEVYNTMFHVLYDERLITVVIDEWNTEMEAAVAAIRSALKTACPPEHIEVDTRRG